MSDPQDVEVSPNAVYTTAIQCSTADITFRKGPEEAVAEEVVFIDLDGFRLLRMDNATRLLSAEQRVIVPISGIPTLISQLAECLATREGG